MYYLCCRARLLSMVPSRNIRYRHSILDTPSLADRTICIGLESVYSLVTLVRRTEHLCDAARGPSRGAHNTLYNSVTGFGLVSSPDIRSVCKRDEEL